MVGPDPTGDMSLAMLDVLKRIDKSNREFRDETTDWQRSFEVNLDTRQAKKAIDVVTKVQTGGGIR